MEPGPIKLAIIGPSFFAYVTAVADEFASRGIEVELFDEKASNSNAAKISYRLGFGHHALSPLPRYQKALTQRIIDGKFTAALVISPEVIRRDFVARLTDAGVPVHLYSWDGTGNKGVYLEYMDLLTSKATFDPEDAAKYNMEYFPLFAQAAFNQETAPAEKRYDVGFCGTLHSQRSELLAGLKKVARQRNLRLGLLLYYHSLALFALRSLVRWAGFAVIRQVRSTSFGKADVAQLFRSSHYVLDIAHPKQSGLTARTFEALGCDARLLTNNRRAAELLPPGLAERVIVFGRAIPPGALVDIAPAPLLPLTAEQRYFLSLQRFVDQLMGNMRFPPR